MKYMKRLFGDWQAKGITSVLHEKKGGYANNQQSMNGLAAKAKNEGVRILPGVQVTGFQFSGHAVSAVETNQGVIKTDYVVVGVGPWIKKIWEMLDLPKAVSIKGRDGKMHNDITMWTFWCLQEGTLGVDPDLGKLDNGQMPPVIHVDTDVPLYSDIDGSLVTDKIWGLYYKPDFSFGGVQGGAMPYKVEKNPDTVNIDPYGPESPEFVVGETFERMWCSALAFCQKRFEGKYPLYKKEPSGGIGAFSPDSFPVFDIFRENCYIVADSNHGYKMLGVGKLVAQEIMGEQSAILEPFRFSRYAQGNLHPVSHSPFPWS
jgi:glycine/D-amino acid oxidase-like deaminating enzyme